MNKPVSTNWFPVCQYEIFFIIVQRRVKRDGTSKIISFSPIILIKSLNLNLEFVCACSNYLLWLCNWVIWVLISSFLPFWTSITAIISIEIIRIFLRIPSKTHVEFGDKYIERKDFILLHKFGLLICTLISENQGLEKSRSYSKLDFFSSL